MLQNLSEEIRECLRRAEECKRLSKTALTPSAIKDYLQMERRWLALARSLNFPASFHPKTCGQRRQLNRPHWPNPGRNEWFALAAFGAAQG